MTHPCLHILAGGVMMIWLIITGLPLQADPSGDQDVRLQREQLLDALAQQHPSFANALHALDEDRLDEAARLLEPLSQRADPVLRDQAKLMLARLYVNQGRYVPARELLESMPDKTSALLDEGEALFMLGVIHAQLMERPQAQQKLTQFLQDHPQAPERLRVSAQVRLRELAAIEEGSLRDVADRMDFSYRQLARALTGEPTRKTQQSIVALLDQLIKDAQDKEQAGASGGQAAPGNPGTPAGVANPSAPAQQSVAPVGEARMGELSGPRLSPAEDWMKLQARDRERVLDTLKTRFPDRYRGLVEQYYRSLSEEPTP